MLLGSQAPAWWKLSTRTGGTGWGIAWGRSRKPRECVHQRSHRGMGSQCGLLSRGAASRGRVVLQAQRGHRGSLQLGGGSAAHPQRGKLKPAGSQLAPQDNNLNHQGSDPVWQANCGGRATKLVACRADGYEKPC